MDWCIFGLSFSGKFHNALNKDGLNSSVNFDQFDQYWGDLSQISDKHLAREKNQILFWLVSDHQFALNPKIK